MAAKDPFPIDGFHHVEFWVGNAYQAAHYYRALMGFRITGYRGPETGVRETASYALEQGDVRFVVTGALEPDHPINRHHLQHGPGVYDVALQVPDAEAAWELALERGAEPAYKPEVVESESGRVVRAGIRAYGETIHSLIQPEGSWIPDFKPRRDRIADPVGLRAIDHVVANVELGKMDELVDFYAEVFGFTLFRHFTDQDIKTEYSALMSKVVADGSNIIKLPINEPATGRKRSQIEEYLLFYRGPGVQHIALSTGDLVQTVRSLRSRGYGLMSVPDTYYDELPSRIPDLDADVEELRELAILADEDEGGRLLQIFSRMMQDRPTFFFEFIERRGAQGFGEGNFKALFEAIERDQAARGNL